MTENKIKSNNLTFLCYIASEEPKGGLYCGFNI